MLSEMWELSLWMTVPNWREKLHIEGGAATIFDRRRIDT
jgi:hypothetical protein